MSSLFRRHAALVAAMILGFVPFVRGGSVRYEFTAGSMAPTLTDLPAGVTASSFSIGSGLGSMFDNGGDPDSLRLSGNDGTSSSTATIFNNNAFFSFSITIDAGTTVSLQSLSLDGKATNASNFFNARTFSSVQGYDSATGDTIGIVGRTSGGTDSNFVRSNLNLATPRSNTSVGGNITNVDFTNLAGPKTVTFYLPFISGTTSSSAYIDLDNIELTFATPVPPVDPVVIKVEDFKVTEERIARVTFSGNQGTPFSLMASDDLVSPVYRKRWSRLTGGTFAATAHIFDDQEAPSHPRRFYVVAGSDPPKARIMPVGDSITEGGGGFVVYKGPLYDKLLAAGYRFEYVGSKASTYVSPTNGTLSLKHEGYSGNNPTQVASQLATHFPDYPADIVIIHAGHNMNVAEDVLTPSAEAAIVSTVETATRSMVNTCRTVNPKVRILLSKVIPAGKLPKYSYIPALNVRLGQVAAELNTEAQPVIIVDQADGFNWENDTVTDKVHPNAAGAEKMATKYFNALVPLLE